MFSTLYLKCKVTLKIQFCPGKMPGLILKKRVKSHGKILSWKLIFSGAQWVKFTTIINNKILYLSKLPKKKKKLK